MSLKDEIKELTIEAYNANERRNYFKVKQNLNRMIKLLGGTILYGDGTDTAFEEHS